MMPPTISISHRARIERAVRRLVKAAINESWKGAKHPDDVNDIERELERARVAYQRALGPK